MSRLERALTHPKEIDDKLPVYTNKVNLYGLSSIGSVSSPFFTDVKTKKNV